MDGVEDRTGIGAGRDGNEDEEEGGVGLVTSWFGLRFVSPLARAVVGSTPIVELDFKKAVPEGYPTKKHAFLWDNPQEQPF